MTLELFNGGDGLDDEALFEELPDDPVSESQARASRDGKEFDHLALEFIESLGAQVEDRYFKVFGYAMDALVVGPNGRRFYVDAHGTPDRRDHAQAGMRRTDTMLKFGFKALRLHQRGCEFPLVLVTSHLPKPNSQAEYLLTELNDVLFDAVATVHDFPGTQRLRAYLNDVPAPLTPLPAPWREVQMPLDFELLPHGGHDDA